MEITERPLGQIKPYPGNPRTIPEKAVASLANSIKKFGFRQPIVVDKDGVIIVGHTRYLAAKKLRMKKAPVHVMDVDEATARAYRVADNRLGEQAAWDISLLTSELRGLEEEAFEMADFGFSEAEIEMARIDELPIMRGQVPEPWGGAPDAFVAQKVEQPRVVLYFGTAEAKERFFEWFEEQDGNWRKQTSKNETYVAYMPKREQEKFNYEDDPHAADPAGAEEGGGENA